jgi:hypothetical protein
MRNTPLKAFMKSPLQDDKKKMEKKIEKHEKTKTKEASEKNIKYLKTLTPAELEAMRNK